MVKNRHVERKLSGEARLVADCIYETAADKLSLYCFHVVAVTPLEASLEEELSEPVELSLHHPIIAYDIDFEEGVVAVLSKDGDELCLAVYRQSNVSFELIHSGSVAADNSYDFIEVQINGGSVLVSLDNLLQVFGWRRKAAIGSEYPWHRIWTRNDESTRLGGWYVRASLLSAQVVSCIVLSTYRTIGSMRVRHGVIELYRLDQFVPRVADILLPEAFVDALQPRILQAARKYVSFDIGEKHALDGYLERGCDTPVIIQVFSESRVGKVSTLCDLLYPKAAVALYSLDPTRPNYPVLGNEWLTSNFPIIRGPAPLRSSLHGLRMVSCARHGRNELIYWGPSRDAATTSQLLQVRSLENVRPLLLSSQSTSDSQFHIDDVSLDGPRILFTCYYCSGEHNGMIHATEPLGSFWGSLEPSRQSGNISP
ncbi:hypothetical protein CBS101457_006118 [Exobasidium rhododendri]|nr:hypothetical protein CBS101457_006118 [Exobasidium rhododendri]